MRNISVASGVIWDAGNRTKCQKHGLSLAEIEHILLTTRLALVHGPRHSTTEARFIAIGRTPAGRPAFVIVTPRFQDGEWMLRPLSARYMHAREIRKYEQETSGLRER